MATQPGRIKTIHTRGAGAASAREPKAREATGDSDAVPPTLDLALAQTKASRMALRKGTRPPTKTLPPEAREAKQQGDKELRFQGASLAQAKPVKPPEDANSQAAEAASVSSA
jgi:hypothetical protein